MLIKATSQTKFWKLTSPAWHTVGQNSGPAQSCLLEVVSHSSKGGIAESESVSRFSFHKSHYKPEENKTFQPFTLGLLKINLT